MGARGGHHSLLCAARPLTDDRCEYLTPKRPATGCIAQKVPITDFQGASWAGSSLQSWLPGARANAAAATTVFASGVTTSPRLQGGGEGAAVSRQLHTATSCAAVAPDDQPRQQAVRLSPPPYIQARLANGSLLMINFEATGELRSSSSFRTCDAPTAIKHPPLRTCGQQRCSGMSCTDAPNHTYKRTRMRHAAAQRELFLDLDLGLQHLLSSAEPHRFAAIMPSPKERAGGLLLDALGVFSSHRRARQQRAGSCSFCVMGRDAC